MRNNDLSFELFTEYADLHRKMCLNADAFGFIHSGGGALFNKDPNEPFGFSIYNGSGFKMKFENGVTVSVIFGSGSFSENRDMHFWGQQFLSGLFSNNAEVAAWTEDNGWITHLYFDPTSYDAVQGRLKADEVLDFMVWCKNFKQETYGGVDNE